MKSPARGRVALAAELFAGSFDGVGRFVRFCHWRKLLRNEPTRTELESMLDALTAGVALVRLEPPPPHLARCNPHFEQMFGRDSEAMAGQLASALWPSLESYAIALSDMLPALLRGSAVDNEYTLRHRDGTLFPCRLQARAIPEGQGKPRCAVFLCEDISRRRKLDEELACALEAAEAASREKSKFVTTISHEIRNPLNAMLGVVHLACDLNSTPDKRDQYWRQLRASALSLKDLMGDTLDLAKIEAGHFELNLQSFSLRALVVDLMSSWGATAEASSIALRSTLADDCPDWVRGDSVRVRQILSNLVSNALKFSAVGETVVHIRRSAPGFVRFQVHDSGPGLDEATRLQLFQPFAQADDEPARRAHGTGMGLVICRELATRMGGSIGVQSAPGQGAVFWVELPLPDAVPATETQARDRDELAQDHRALADARVLLADDDETNLLIIEALLTNWGAQVDCVRDGRAAAAAAIEACELGRPFDILLIDYYMPLLDGLSAIRILRQSPDLRALIVIGMTGTVLNSDRAAGLDAGMNEVLSKPIDPSLLLARLVQYRVGRHGA